METGKPRISKIKNRQYILSPIVERGIDRECVRSDFIDKSNNDQPVNLGSFGKVLQVLHRTTKTYYYIKVIHKKRLTDAGIPVENINLILSNMYKIKHKNILTIVNHFEDEDNLYLIFPILEFTSLYKLIEGKAISEEKALCYMKQIIQTVDYLHSIGIICRELKPENILVEKDYVFITDYGWSILNHKGDIRRTTAGKSLYISPEVINRDKIGYKTDIWHIGLILFEILTSSYPFYSKNDEELKNAILSLHIIWPEDMNIVYKHINIMLKILEQLFW